MIFFIFLSLYIGESGQAGHLPVFSALGRSCQKFQINFMVLWFILLRFPGILILSGELTIFFILSSLLYGKADGAALVRFFVQS